MSRDAVETIKYKNKTINIYIDDNPYSPRENDNLCVIHVAHRNARFGDKNYNNSDSILSAEKEAKDNGDIILPLYMYEHSGRTISLSPFSCPWDSGQVGFVQITKKAILENWGKKKLTKQLRERALKSAESEVSELDSYLRGEVYGYQIEEDGDSCWGYIGDIKYCIEDAKSVIDYEAKQVLQSFPNK
jgi:hypothetical protein